MAHLLIIEDDALLRDGLGAQLTQAGHTVVTCANGEDGQTQLQTSRFDGVVLDLGLPRISGLELLHWLRQRLAALPVLILTARDSTEDRVQGLNAGADDYLTKPFDMAELQARLGALLRRARLPAFGGSLELPSQTGRRPRVDAQLPQAWLGDEALELTQREWALLSLLVTNAGRVVSREDVLETWRTSAPDSAGATGGSRRARQCGCHRRVGVQRAGGVHPPAAAQTGRFGVEHPQHPRPGLHAGIHRAMTDLSLRALTRNPGSSGSRIMSGMMNPGSSLVCDTKPTRLAMS